jgi:hypothetical protein
MDGGGAGTSLHHVPQPCSGLWIVSYWLLRSFSKFIYCVWSEIYTLAIVELSGCWVQ